MTRERVELVEEARPLGRDCIENMPRAIACGQIEEGADQQPVAAILHQREDLALHLPTVDLGRGRGARRLTLGLRFVDRILVQPGGGGGVRPAAVGGGLLATGAAWLWSWQFARGPLEAVMRRIAG